MMCDILEPHNPWTCVNDEHPVGTEVPMCRVTDPCLGCSTVGPNWCPILVDLAFEALAEIESHAEG